VLTQSVAPRILIVDDDPAVRALLRLVFTQDGYQVTEASDGQQGLDAYAAAQPDLVLLDLMMPVMDGLEACQRLAPDAERRHVPLLIITSLDNEASINQAFEAGAIDYLTKPLNYAAVRRRVRYLLRAKQVEDAIRRAKQEWETALDAVGDMVIMTDTARRIVRCNRAVIERLGLQYADVLGRSLPKLLLGDQSVPEGLFQAEIAAVQFAALPGWFRVSTFPIQSDGRLTGLVHVVRDITHELAMATALRQSERQYRLLAENTADVVWVLSTETMRFSFVSPSVRGLLGYTPEEMLNQTLDGVIAPESWPEMTTGLLGRLEAFRDGDPAARQRIDQILLLRRDGTTVWTEVSTTLMLNEHQDCDLVGVTRDISVRKQAEDALAQQAYILDRLDEGVSVADQAGNLIFTNRSLDAMFGYAHSELAGQHISVLSAETAKHPNLGGVAELHAQLLSESRWTGELRCRRKDGTVFTAAARVNQVEMAGRRLVVTVQSDITEQKQAQAWMLNAQKLADLGTLAAGVAHEMNSPLQVITGVSQSLLRRLDDGALTPENLRRNLDVVHRNGWRCAEIVRSLHTYARVSGGQAGPADLDHLVQDTLLLIEHQLRSWSNISVVTDLAPGLPPLECDRNQIIQILINLLTNARDAMPSGGEIKIATGYDEAAAQLVLTVADTGTGIPDTIRAKIFDPFFTTKPVGKGTGLGLSIVAGIVRAYNGTISVDSHAGHGTNFTLRFPTARPKLPGPVPPGPASGRFDDYSEAGPVLAAPALMPSLETCHAQDPVG